MGLSQYSHDVEPELQMSCRVHLLACSMPPILQSQATFQALAEVANSILLRATFARPARACRQT